MPFTKRGKDDYVSPSGRHFNAAQVRLYYAGGGKFPGEKEKKMARGGVVGDVPVEAGEEGFPDVRKEYTERPEGIGPMTKGAVPRHLDGAHGGPVLKEGRSIFMKTPDTFRTDAGRQQYGGKSDPLANPKGDGKSLKPIKPRT